MGRTNKERILDYLWSIAPDWATNSQIQKATGIRSHQQVYLLTLELMRTGLIRGEQHGREWVFGADESLAVQLASPGRASYSELSSPAREALSPRASVRGAVRQRPGTLPARLPLQVLSSRAFLWRIVLARTDQRLAHPCGQLRPFRSGLLWWPVSRRCQEPRRHHP